MKTYRVVLQLTVDETQCVHPSGWLWADLLEMDALEETKLLAVSELAPEDIVR